MQTGNLALLRQPVLEKENSEFKPALLCSKIDLVSHPIHGRGVMTDALLGLLLKFHKRISSYVVQTNILNFILSSCFGHCVLQPFSLVKFLF